MTRSVMVYEYKRTAQGGSVYQELGEGKFHQFGLDIVETSDGVASFSTAIVEMPDGTVMNVGTHMIKFIDIKEQS